MDAELFYTHDALDRNPEFRKQSMSELLANPESRVIPLWRSRNLFQVTAQQVSVTMLSPGLFAVEETQWLFLGIHQNAPLFALDFSGQELEQLDWYEEDHEFEELRRMIGDLSNEEASLLSYARAMMTWHRNHQYCGRCGSRTQPQSNGHERICTNANCGKVAYPRVDPAVIVLIEHTFEDGTEKCLLGRTKRYPAGMYSTLAGFVEPGETLEATVAREMHEEVGLEVTDIRYVASQPWPFPTSLMLGFYARALHTNITLAEDEVAEARWFSRSELRELSEKGEIFLSRKDSIARFLITSWLNLK